MATVLEINRVEVSGETTEERLHGIETAQRELATRKRALEAQEERERREQPVVLTPEQRREAIAALERAEKAHVAHREGLEHEVKEAAEALAKESYARAQRRFTAAQRALADFDIQPPSNLGGSFLIAARPPELDALYKRIDLAAHNARQIPGTITPAKVEKAQAQAKVFVAALEEVKNYWRHPDPLTACEAMERRLAKDFERVDRGY